MSDVLEQGATPRYKGMDAGDFFDQHPPAKGKRGQPMKRGYRPGAADRPRYTPPGHEGPRPARGPGRNKTPKRQMPKPGYASPLIPKVNPDGGKPLPNAFRPLPGKGAGAGLGYSPKFGRAFPKFRLPLPGGPLWDIVPLFDSPGFFRPPLPHPVPNPANGWVQSGICPQVLPLVDTAGRKASTIDCIGGQAGGTNDIMPGVMLPLQDSWTRFGYWYWNQNTTIVRYSHGQSWTRGSASVNNEPKMLTQGAAVPVAPPFGGLNPNAMRGMPSIPATEPQAGQPVGQTSPAPAVTAASQASPLSDAAVEQALQDGTGTGVEIAPGKPPVVKPAGPRKPPPEGTKETKVLSTAKRIMIATFKALDDVSEAAEVVDAAYDALPDATKKKWRCNDKRGLIDAAGQYGLDQADCKAKALFHNWHKVDFTSFVENVIKNEVQDRIVGFIARTNPPNLGQAVEQAELKFNKLLDLAMDDLLDSIESGEVTYENLGSWAETEILAKL